MTTPTFSIKNVTRIAGRGVIVRLVSNASLSKLPPWELKVTANPLPAAPVSATFALASIPEGAVPFDRGRTIQAVRTPIAVDPDSMLLGQAQRRGWKVLRLSR